MDEVFFYFSVIGMLISVTNFSGSQILSRDTDADLAEKNSRVLRAVEPAYGKLHVKRIINTQRLFDPDKAAGRRKAASAGENAVRSMIAANGEKLLKRSAR